MRGEPCVAAVAQNPNVDDTSYLMRPLVPKCLGKKFLLVAPIKVMNLCVKRRSAIFWINREGVDLPLNLSE